MEKNLGYEYFGNQSFGVELLYLLVNNFCPFKTKPDFVVETMLKN